MTVQRCTVEFFILPSWEEVQWWRLWLMCEALCSDRLHPHLLQLTCCLPPIRAVAVGSGSMGGGGRGGGRRADLLWSTPSLLPPSTTMFSSLHLTGSRNYLSPCKGASSIPWFIACSRHNGSSFDWIEGAGAVTSLLGHSERKSSESELCFFFFSNPLKAACLSAARPWHLLSLSWSFPFVVHLFTLGRGSSSLFLFLLSPFVDKWKCYKNKDVIVFWRHRTIREMERVCSLC